ncbi:hypothetical protein ACS0PU_002272 [Formica fusca]
MLETWIEEKRWEKIKERLPRKFTWKAQMAKRRNRKGRARGGMLIGVKKNIKIEEEREEEVEGRLVCKVRVGEEMWRIIGIYVNGDMDRKLESLKSWMEAGVEEVKKIIGGDFNARTGEKGGWMREEEAEEGGKGRRSKDKKINGEGRKLIECIENRGWSILNGSVKGEEEGEFTYIGGRGETVIDYFIGDDKVREKIERVEIGEEVDSDHLPVIAWIKGSMNKGGRKQRDGRIKKQGVWDEKRKEVFRKELGNVRRGDEGIQEEIEEMEKRLRTILEKDEEKNGIEKGKRRGW